MLWTAKFWKGAAERGLKTFAQAFVGFIVVGETGLLDLDWTASASVAGAAALASLLTSIGNADFVAGEPRAAVRNEDGSYRVAGPKDSDRP